MAEKLSITIALNGGKQIEQQLEGIGEAGKKAFEDILTAAEKAGGFKNLKPEELAQKFKDLGITGKDAIDKITGAVQHAMRLETMVNVVSKLETGFAGLSTAALGFLRALGPIGAIAGTIGTALVKAAIDAAAAINKVDAAAIKAGMSVETFDRLRQGLEAAKLSAKGVDAAMVGIGSAEAKAKLDEVGKAFKFLQDSSRAGIVLPRVDQATGFGAEQMQLLVEAARGVGPAVEPAKKALAELGVTVVPNVNKSLSEMIALWGDTSVGTAAFVEQLRKMPDSANRSALAIDAFKEGGVELVQALRSGLITDDQFKERLGTISQGATDAANKVEQSANRMATAWDRFKTTGDLSQLNTVLKEIGPQAKGVVDEIGALTSALDKEIKAQFLVTFQQDIKDTNSAIEGLITTWERLIAVFKEGNAARSNPVVGGGPGEAIPGKASGGLIGGRGSGTSDSNLAWVSRGEHIMPARAVAQPGVLALLEALRRTGGNLRGVMNGMGRFAAGGVVPRFAAGGLVGGGMGHLGTVDLRTDHGVVRLMAGASAVEQLSRLAVTKRMTSTGRKPGFIG